jgi:hypothetical protein
MMKKHLLLVVAFAVSVAPVLAQQPSAGPQGKTGKDYKRDPNEFKWQELKNAPDLPDLPQYGGNAKYKQGTASPNARGGTAFSLVYTSKDPANQVMEWYSRTLSQYKWNVTQSKSGTMISAKKGKNVCTVSTTMRSDPKSVCDFIITFREDR